MPSRQGFHPKVVLERLGHANGAITLGVYRHISPHMQTDAAEKIDAGMRAALAGWAMARVPSEAETPDRRPGTPSGCDRG